MPACYSFVKPALLRPSRRQSEAMSWLAASLTCDKLRDHYVDSKEGWTDALLVLDCRPFLTFNDCHILSSVNVYCPSIVRRRARGGRLPLSTVIPQAEIREKLCRGHYLSVVVYDENSGNINSTTDDSMARLVIQCLKQDAGVKHPLFLEGGFQKFRQRFPYLCLGSEGPGPPGFPDIRPRQNLDLQQEPVEILPHVYLGSAGHAADSGCLRRLGITAVLNVSPGPPPPNSSSLGLAYKCIPVEDSGSADISFWFRDAIKFIEGVKSSRGKVLVHCLAGVSRSATICLAYLMHAQRLRLEDAYEFVKARRSIISPNFNFMGQLLRFETQLFSSPSPAQSSSSSSPSSCSVTGNDDKCLKRAQRFVFDLNGEVPSPSSGGLLTPLCTNTPIMSPS